MNRPQRRNAPSLEQMRELIAAFGDLGDSGAQGIVLAGNGQVFNAGHDFADVAGADLPAVRLLLGTCTELMTLMQQPVVGRVHGLATAAGCQLVASADLAVASEDPACGAGRQGRLVLPHAHVASPGTWAASALWSWLALSGDVIDARTALD